jgi:hypothetical protein
MLIDRGKMTRKFGFGILSLVILLLFLPNEWSVHSPGARSCRHSSFLFAEATAPVTLPRNATRALRIETDQNMTFGQILRQAGRKGLGGGLPGAIAGVVQVLSLMGLRTVINYQMRYGTTFMKALHVLYKVS